MGYKDTWDIRIHGISGYMGYKDTWDIRIHGI